MAPASLLVRSPSAVAVIAHVDLAFSSVSAAVPISAEDAAVQASAVAAFVVALAAYFALVAAIVAAGAVAAAVVVGTADCQWQRWKQLLVTWDWSAPWEGRQVPGPGQHYGGRRLERQQGERDSCWW